MYANQAPGDGAIHVAAAPAFTWFDSVFGIGAQENLDHDIVGHGRRIDRAPRNGRL